MSAHAVTSLPRGVKPRFRGRIHQVAFFFSIPQGIALVAAAAGLMGRIAATVYALSLTGLYGVSAAYHRLPKTKRQRLRMQRIDHSMIFVLIAGTYTPISLLVLDGPWAIALLAAVWAGAIAGIALKLFGFDKTKKLGGAMYIILGWMAVVASPWLVTSLSRVVLALILVGGLFYTAGAIVLARRRPDPRPLVFGYHEVWHAMTIVGGLCHYAAILILLLSS